MQDKLIIKKDIVTAIAKNNIGEIAKIARELTIHNAFHGKSINLYRREIGEQKTAQLLAILISNLNDNININLKLNEEQIARIAMDYAAEYNVFTLEDYVLLFKRIEDGHYGSTMKLDKQILNEWRNRYAQEKDDIVYDEYLDKKGQIDNFKQDRTIWSGNPVNKDAKIKRLEARIEGYKRKFTEMDKKKPKK